MKKILWVLLDNRMGSVSQAKGVIQEINTNLIEVVTKELKYSHWAGLPNFIRRHSLLGITNPEVLDGDAPDIVLSTSRRTAPVALHIKNKNKKTKLVQLMFPGNYGLKEFSKIFLPEHDANKKKLSNFYFTVGSPHKINQATLAEAKHLWGKEFSALPEPRTALIIGGSIKGKPFTKENALDLAQEVKSLKERIGGSLLVTDSRRTGNEAEEVIMSVLKDIPAYTYLWGSNSKNPLVGYYACADNIIVTGNSVSMCCESCGTGKPVFIFEGKDWLTSKHLRFTKSLFEGGYATLLKKDCEQFRGGKILYPSAEIALEIAKLANQ